MEHSAGKNIIIMRTIAGFTQAPLARAAGIDPSRLSAIENESKSATLDELVKLAKALDCKPHKLLPSAMLTDMQEEILENQSNISTNKKEIKKLWHAIDEIKNK